MMLNFEIFWVFFKISFMALGGVFGVLPELERMVVTQHHWISHERFIESYVIAQFVPGPNMAMCPLIGYWVNGWQGFSSAFLGIYLGPIFVMGLAFFLFRRYQNLLWVHRLEYALRPLVLGLMMASLLKFLWLQIQAPGISPDKLILSQALGIGLCGVGLWLYTKKYLGPLQIIFASGGVWWLLNRLFLWT